MRSFKFRSHRPMGPGLGVRYDWDFIRRHAVASRVYE
ncbi:MAG: hypothetical protein RI906_1722 [Pseudomonadota bacterium]|jgi:L-alanine-DL-glutamate epimerase-like enolase superfamily enzyme